MKRNQKQITEKIGSRPYSRNYLEPTNSLDLVKKYDEQQKYINYHNKKQEIERQGYRMHENDIFIESRCSICNKSLSWNALFDHRFTEEHLVNLNFLNIGVIRN